MSTESLFLRAHTPRSQTIFRTQVNSVGLMAGIYPENTGYLNYATIDWDVEYDDDNDPSCGGCDDPDCDDPACERLRGEIADWLESDLNPINEEAYDEFRRFQQENES